MASRSANASLGRVIDQRPGLVPIRLRFGPGMTRARGSVLNSEYLHHLHAASLRRLRRACNTGSVRRAGLAASLRPHPMIDSPDGAGFWSTGLWPRSSLAGRTVPLRAVAALQIATEPVSSVQSKPGSQRRLIRGHPHADPARRLGLIVM